MIPEHLMEQLRYIEIYTRRAVRDHRIGDYRSPLHGRGFEFDQHKRYQHGDDYRQIDWNVTARMRHPYVKRDFEEKELSAVIMADLSRSMEFSSVDQSKRELLLLVAATLAFSAASDNMKVGLIGFTDEVEVNLPLKKGSAQMWHILESLYEAEPASAGTNFLPALEYLDARLKTSTLIFCISDFVNIEQALASRPLKHLVRRHDFIPLILEDGWDGKLPRGRGFLRFHDAEGGDVMLFNLSRRKRELYNSLMRERRIALERALYRLNLDHIYLQVGEPFLDPILGFFLGRKRSR
ncbi:MAG TPA: DUF58 domain-containing protein [Candidatus Acidoferrales bacterium]|nr:DUF58 domain-containing protein [Candidatus Acidoferrales bacterium]